MAIVQPFNINIPLLGDGVSTSVTVDISGYITSLPVAGQTPVSVSNASTNGAFQGGVAVSASLIKSNVLLTFSPAPSATNGSVTFTLGF
jgi:hypothetical protein